MISFRTGMGQVEIFKENKVMKLIDKDAILAEIERRIKTNKECMLGLRNLDYYQGKVDALNDTISFIDALEVKEVDLDFQWFAKEMDDVFDLPSEVTTNTEEEPLNWEYAIAKHFFELGLNASNPLTWEDVKLIWNITDEMDNMPEEEFYKEVLKRFTAQKGE